MSDALRRTIRTFVRTFVGVLLTSGVFSAVSTKGVVDWAVLQKVFISAIAAGVVGVLTYAHNWAEDNTAFPAILKSTPSAGLNPVTEDPPA
jgi:hypothetical protein